jgi:hypothetical protein
MTTSALRQPDGCPAVPTEERDRAIVWQRAAIELARFGRIPGTKWGAGSIEWGLILHVLAQGPEYVSCNARVAEQLGVHERTVIAASGRVSDYEIAPGVPLMAPRRDNILVPLNGPCPWDPESEEPWARSNKHPWELAAYELLEAVRRERAREKAEREAREKQRQADKRARWERRRSERRAAQAVAPEVPSPAAAGGAGPLPPNNMDPHGCSQDAPILKTLDLSGLSSFLNLEASMEPEAPSPQSPRRLTAANVAGETPPETIASTPAPGGASSAPRAPNEGEHSACRGLALAPGAPAAPAATVDEKDVEALAATWNALDLRNDDGTASVVRDFEKRTLRKRLREGYATAELMAAIIGAGQGPDGWLKTARKPFGYVFHGFNGSIARFANEGRKVQSGQGPTLLVQVRTPSLPAATPPLEPGRPKLQLVKPRLADRREQSLTAEDFDRLYGGWVRDRQERDDE